MFKVKIIKMVKVLFPNILRSDDYIYYLKKMGISIGKGTIFYSPGKSVVDVSRPSQLKIGEYCKITAGVIILTHDYSRSVLRRVYGEIIGEAQETVIGDNVFIGMNSIVLMGSKIGNNVIIGAGSLITGIIPDNVVVAGNPAHVIRTLDEHYHIRKRKSLEEAKSFAKNFYTSNGRVPTIKEMDPFYPLFLERDIGLVEKNNLTIHLGGDNYNETVTGFLQSEPLYTGYREFLTACDLPNR